MKRAALKAFLDEKVHTYNTVEFIESDPIQIPHKFTIKEDIEIAGFLIATIAWGNRKSIINNGTKMMNIMGNAPYEFIMQFSEKDLERVHGFVHRTFNAEDLTYFFKALRNIYMNHNGLESVFKASATPQTLQPAIHHFKRNFFELPHPTRTEKHVSDPFKNSAAKRINIFNCIINAA